MFTLKDDHKNHLLFLEKQPVQVVQDFCKLAIDYLNKGPNQKIYATAAQKLDVEAEIIQASIEGLINLLLECIKHKLTIDDLKKLLLNLGFDEEKESVISQLYISKQNDISKALENTGFKLPQYHNMEWRFEVQVASRLVPSQIIPTMTLDFELKNTDSTDKIEHVTLQTDAPNLLHLCQVIENAIKEGKSQHVRKIKKNLKI
ncbi:COMM domain-containing protein 2 [Aphidius gifuensis]|uniref:COMM domain-containing protein 2 n=1 Tax=Aphidius gifuensis TaxID=684658 RepID=UPI001CDCF05E|nr:COMM domain-containing protein 2 [Aphidius gifuensis]